MLMIQYLRTVEAYKCYLNNGKRAQFSRFDKTNRSSPIIILSKTLPSVSNSMATFGEALDNQNNSGSILAQTFFQLILFKLLNK